MLFRSRSRRSRKFRVLCFLRRPCKDMAYSSLRLPGLFSLASWGSPLARLARTVPKLRRFHGVICASCSALAAKLLVEADRLGPRQDPTFSRFLFREVASFVAAWCAAGITGDGGILLPREPSSCCQSAIDIVVIRLTGNKSPCSAPSNAGFTQSGGSPTVIRTGSLNPSYFS